jgi:hypothetical protein
MSAWVWVLIAVGGVIVTAIVLWRAVKIARTRHLRERFGPEYEREVKARESRDDAETELAEREQRRAELDIRPLSDAAVDGYKASWEKTQARFVDDPRAAVNEADELIASVMRDRGYPVDDFEQRAADISVDHPHVVEHYRTAHEIAQTDGAVEPTTDHLREAMQHYRALFEELLEPAADESAAQDDGEDGGARGA